MLWDFAEPSQKDHGKLHSVFFAFPVCTQAYGVKRGITPFKRKILYISFLQVKPNLASKKAWQAQTLSVILQKSFSLSVSWAENTNIYTQIMSFFYSLRLELNFYQFCSVFLKNLCSSICRMNVLSSEFTHIWKILCYFFIAAHSSLGNFISKIW